MSVEPYPGQLDPKDKDAVIWRFMNLEKFGDLVTTRELYFCRADLFNDESEGVPPEEYYASQNLNPLDLRDRRQIDDSRGCDAQFREAFYVSCWHLFREETWKMWKQYGRDGVAICSRYRLLRSALDAMDDRAYIGLVRYGWPLMIRNNVLRFIFQKGTEYEHEAEVRAVLWIADPHAPINRHIDIDNRVYPRPLSPPPDCVPRGQRRRVNLQSLLTDIVVTPWASTETMDEVTGIVRSRNLGTSIRPSDLSRYRQFLPDPQSPSVL